MTKRELQQIATRQSQNAQAVTRALRVHGWKTRWDGAGHEGREATTEERREALRRAVAAARRVERDADMVRMLVEQYAEEQGAL